METTEDTLVTRLRENLAKRTKETRELRARVKALNLENEGIRSAARTLAIRNSNFMDQIEALKNTRIRLKERVADAYTERAHVLAVLAHMVPSIIVLDRDTEDHSLRFILHMRMADGPNGILSVNIHELDIPLFEGVAKRDLNGEIKDGSLLHLKNRDLEKIESMTLTSEQVRTNLQLFSEFLRQNLENYGRSAAVQDLLRVSHFGG